MDDGLDEPDTELKRLRMRAEVGAESPLWTETGTLVDLDQLPLSSELSDALGRWADDYWDNMHDPRVLWDRRGDALYLRLVEELGPEYEVSLDDS